MHGFESPPEQVATDTDAIKFVIDAGFTRFNEVYDEVRCLITKTILEEKLKDFRFAYEEEPFGFVIHAGIKM